MSNQPSIPPTLDRIHFLQYWWPRILRKFNWPIDRSKSRELQKYTYISTSGECAPPRDSERSSKVKVAPQHQHCHALNQHHHHLQVEYIELYVHESHSLSHTWGGLWRWTRKEVYEIHWYCCCCCCVTSPLASWVNWTTDRRPTTAPLSFPSSLFGQTPPPQPSTARARLRI